MISKGENAPIAIKYFAVSLSLQGQLFSEINSLLPPMEKYLYFEHLGPFFVRNLAIMENLCACVG